MEILKPTIRKAGSEIWITFNPHKKTDYIYQNFVVNPPESCESIFVSWRDNPWFSEELREEMEDLKKRDYDAYLNVWEGQPKVLLAGAVYMEELRKVRLDKRITEVPWQKGIPVDTFWDLGRSDSTTIWFRQRVGFEWRYIKYYQARQKELDHFLEYLQRQSYIYGYHNLPHDAKAKQLGSKMSIEERFRAAYPEKVRIVKRLSVQDGIDAARTILANSWFDEKECEKGLECLYNYHYEVVDQITGQLSLKPVHNWASHGADSYRYSAISTSQRAGKPDDYARVVNPEGYSKLQIFLNRLGQQSSTSWMG